MLKETAFVDTLIKLLTQAQHVTFKNKATAEAGYLTFLVELGIMLLELRTKNDIVKAYLDGHACWDQFVEVTLKPQIDHRKGALYDDPRIPKNNEGF